MVNGERIKKLMKEKGLSEYELAKQVGIGQPMVSHITRGLREPSLTVLGRIAQTLGVKVADLIEEDPNTDADADECGNGGSV